MKENLFKNKKANFKKLLEYGFTEKEGAYHFSAPILDNQFVLSIEISNDERLKTRLLEISSQEEYVLHLTQASGQFVGKVRGEYERVLQEISDNCFERDVFKGRQSLEIIEYVKTQYGDDLEYLWEKFSNNAVWRRKDNKKWYGALLVVSKIKLKLNSDEVVEILDLRADPTNISTIVDGKTIFEGYHMNKKHWITIILDYSLPTKEIIKFIDESFALAQRK